MKAALPILAFLTGAMLGQTGTKPTPPTMAWSVRNVAEQPGPTGNGNVRVFPVADIVCIRPGGGAHTGKTYIERRDRLPATVVNGEWTYWRDMWKLDTGISIRDLTSR